MELVREGALELGCRGLGPPFRVAIWNQCLVEGHELVNGRSRVAEERKLQTPVSIGVQQLAREGINKNMECWGVERASGERC
mmetsp:Transcript_7860/g.12495  ORF Transcript_7860/g.12495 Transcript_7860/m.12495 type:complete len:82 (+) Transcript_7860:192-437(+)